MTSTAGAPDRARPEPLEMEVAMTATTKTADPRVSANAAAVWLSAQLGRSVTAKQVRTVARATMPAYQDDAYTQHAYSKGDLLALLAAFQTRTTRRGASVAGSGPSGQIVAADVAKTLGLSAPKATGRAKSAPKAKAAPKVAPATKDPHDAA
jgi:hypothetical protein